MHHYFRLLWAASSAVLLFALAGEVSAAETPAPVTLRIAYLKGTSDLTLAKAKGTLDRELAPLGVKVVWAGPFPAAAPAFEALNAGSVDLTSGSSTSFVAAVAGGVPLAIFGYQRMPKRGEGIVVKTDSGIQSIKDLVGKRVAVNRGGTGEYLLVRALDKNGIEPEKVTRSYLTPGETGTAFVGNHVDAWATWDPFLSIAIENYGGRILADSSEIGSENAVGYFVRQDFLQNYRAVVKAVLDVLKQENAWTKTHALEAGKVWTQELGLPISLAQRLGDNNVSPLTTVSPSDVEQMAHIATWYYENRITPVLADVTSHSVNLDK
jgi:sulfonate transport system substrate-binding protein